MVREHPERITELPGIGEDLAGKITEIVQTGRLGALAELEIKVPKGVAELMHLPGLGPRRVRLLHDGLGIKTLGQLQAAAKAGRVRSLKGFGARTEQKLLQALEVRGDEPRILRPVAAQYAESQLAWLRALKGVKRAEVAGSYRRCKETVGDLDILVTCAPGTPVIERFVKFPRAREVMARGDTRASIRLASGLQVDLRVLAEEAYGAGLYYFTGSKAHNIAVRGIARKRGLKINEYGVFRGAERVAGRTEAEVLKTVGLPWIPPELRENQGEIEAAAHHALPHLVQLPDIRGDLQTHTTDSDGKDSLEAMARAAEALGYQYLAVTDHSPAVRVAGGLDRNGFRAQMKRIDRLNARLDSLTVLKGAEVDILADGTLDLDDATLAALDVVVISLHSKLDLPPREQTRRVLKALARPSVDIFGHPRGRLIPRRPGARFDLAQVCRSAAEHGIFLEVNAQPERLDLDDLSARAAVQSGVRLAISTDAHAVAELGFMRWGVDQARRGWVERKDVVNTLPLDRLLKLLHGRRRA